MMRLAARPKLVVAQRKAIASGSSAVHVPHLDGGRPLDGAVRSQMESGFGRDFSQVRIHDGPAAAESARTASALAYTAGNDIVFGAGRFAPSTPAGTALLAHELAHTIQQGGVQHKAEGTPAVSADHALEAEADRAATAIAQGEPAPALTRMSAPALMRTEASAAGASKASASSTPASLPDGMELIDEKPPGKGATEVLVRVPNFTLPQAKGAGKWVTDAYKAAGDGGRLVFSPLLNGGRVAAWKEGHEDYQSKWLGNLGFSDMKSLGAAILKSTDPTVVAALTDKGVKKAVDGMASGGLEGSGFDIDHIVEKQIGGTSMPSNLQLLVAAKNRISGRQTYEKLTGLVTELRQQQYRPRATRIQITIKEAVLPAGDTTDPCYLIETFLRAGKIKGSASLMEAAAGLPVMIHAGGQGETIRVGIGESPVDSGARRVVPGMRLTTYKRNKSPKKPAGSAAVDDVMAELDSRALSKSNTDQKDAQVDLIATIDDTAAPETSVGGKAATEAVAAAKSGERRKLTFGKTRPKIAFYYPYLSPGELTKYDMAADGSISGEGVIHPTLKFLPNVNIRFGPDLLKATAPLDAKKFKSPVPGIHFTDGMLELQLADASGPKFAPSGQLKFEIGPAAKPLILGEFNAGQKNGVLSATGSLTPAQALPGIKEAKGEFSYDAIAGWSGKLRASSSKIPNATVDVVLGFRQEGDQFVTYVEGGIKATIRNDKKIELKAVWDQSGLIYTGELDWPKPFPIVENVTLRGRYAADQLDIQGDTTIHYRQWDGGVTIRYQQKDGQPGKLSGKGHVKVETKNKKASGNVNVEVDDAGELTGDGKISYQLTDKVTPELGVKLAKGGHLTIGGSVKVSDFELFKKWPEKGGERTLISAKPSFKIPTPIPAVNAAINIEAGVGIAYGIGPGKITGVELSGSFDPLEDNPAITAKLKGRFIIPTHVNLIGKISARIGVEVAAGAVGIDGGVTVRPAFGIGADAIVDVSASYEKGSFDFSGKAFIEVVPKASLGVDLTASIYAAWHALEYQWSYPVAAFEWTFPTQIRLNVGEIGYSSATGMRWPKLEDIALEPKDLSPLKMMQDVLDKRKTGEKQK